MGASAIIGHGSPHEVAAWRAGVPISAGRLLAEAVQLARQLPPAQHLLNACTDRVAFTVGFLACLIADRVSLLPAAHTPEVIGHLAGRTGDALCLTDDPACSIDLPQMRFPAHFADEPAAWPPPEITDERLCARLFTSGSTGVPMPHLKTFTRVAAGTHAASGLFGLLDGRRHTFVATVPAQHMYGLETSVLLPLLTGHALCAERPFYPLDVCETLARVPAPRVLVSTPMHLRALLGAGVTLPAVELMISATAPLSQAEAQEVEQRFGTRLVEIYGSTETGQLAVRRSALTDLWQPWTGVTLEHRDGQAWALGGHMEQPTPLNDVLEIRPDGRFLLLGRASDQVNIAGKRSSLAYLNHQLCSIQGVQDGAFFEPEENLPSRTGVTRVAAIVAAPGLSASGLIEELRRRIDPVFLPRPLLLVERLPRNSLGKLPLTHLRELAAARETPAGARP